MKQFDERIRGNYMLSRVGGRYVLILRGKLPGYEADTLGEVLEAAGVRPRSQYDEAAATLRTASRESMCATCNGRGVVPHVPRGWRHSADGYTKPCQTCAAAPQEATEEVAT